MICMCHRGYIMTINHTKEGMEPNPRDTAQPGLSYVLKQES